MADEIPLNEQGDIPTFHKLVGEVIRRWAQIENSLWSIVGILLNVDQFRARIVVESIPTGRPRREFVSRLAETYLVTESLPRFRSLMDRMDKLGLTRNLLAHAPMHINVDGSKNMVMRDVFPTKGPMSGGLDFDFTPFPLNDLRTLAQALDKLMGEFVTFELEVRVHVTARIHREPPTGPVEGSPAQPQ
jgi:hypothetical protein